MLVKVKNFFHEEKNHISAENLTLSAFYNLLTLRTI